MSNKTKSDRQDETSAKGQIPNLRFPQFRDAPEWEEKEVGKVFKVTRGEVLSMTLVQGSQTKEAPYPVYSSQTKNGGLSGFYSDYLYENAITWTTDGANAGDVNYRPGKFYCTNVCGVLSNADGHANACVAAIINSVSKSHVSYVGNPKLMNGVMGKIKIPFPSVPEQQKIAACLSSVDELIAAQTQKLDSFKAHKKGLMQQLFPAEGETVPKRRFPEFQDAGEWENKPLDSLLTIGNGKDYKHLSKGDVPVYGSGGYMLSVNDYLHDGESVCIGRKGTINNPMFLTGKFWTVDTLFYTHSFKDCLPKFVYLLFQNINWLSHNEAGGVPSLSKTNINKIDVSLPSPVEQKKIADCLFSIDELISAQTQKLDTLMTHKKGLMQQLFPSPDEVSG